MSVAGVQIKQSAIETVPVEPGPSTRAVARLALCLAVSGLCLTATSVGLAQESDLTRNVTTPNQEARVVNEAELEKMRRFLERTQPDRGIVAQRTLPEGDRIDCISIEAQPALRAYEMQGHQLQLQPQTLPQGPSSLPSGNQADAERHGEPAAQQAVVCPEGSVPYRRLTIEDLSRFRTLNEFLGKLPKGEPGLEGATPTPHSRSLSPPAAPIPPSAPEPPRIGATDYHQYAVMHHTVDNRGADAVLNLWSSYVETSSEFSLSQIWVVRGSGCDTETVEAGWQVYNQLYGDYRSRLFIYFTPDNYGQCDPEGDTAGCYNLSCGEFVQTNNSVIIGGPWPSYSQVDGSQLEITLQWFKDGDNGHWWLRYGDIWVGYYPRELFDSNGLQTRAARVAFGGEILDTVGDGKHTETDMGSGHWPYERFGKAAYQRTLRYIDTSSFYRDATGTAYSLTDYQCYDLHKLSSGEPWREHIYLGGSGRNTECQ